MINEIELRSGSVLVFTIPIGDLPPSQAKELISKMKDTIKAIFVDHEVIFLPSREELTSSLTIIHR